MNVMTSRRRTAVLLTVCLAVFAINLDTTIVNVALPDLSRQLNADTGTLQWVVDGYNLAFAALVLAGGALGDRIGRRSVLLAGLAGFAAASLAASLAGSAGALVGWRFAMGSCAALIYPTTLSIITNAYPDRGERTRAIGIWGAVTGLGVAVGPVTGGALLAAFSWRSVFVALIPVAVLAVALTAALVPESRAEHAPGLDLPGLASSSAAIGVLVYTIIEAPSRGWTAPASLAGFAAAAVIGVCFVLVERRRDRPMIDVGLFRVPAFSAASGSVTVAFFALFGFIFIVTQYMQLIRGWGTLSTGTRILPVAASIAAGSVAGARLAGRTGARVVVSSGLILLGGSFAWIATSSQGEGYLLIAAQMVVMGLGLGLTSTPATESILSVLPPAKAGIGSAVNDATREAGGTLGVAVIGSVFSSVYLHRLAGTPIDRLPAPAAAAARHSVGAAAGLAQQAHSAALLAAVDESFMSAFHAGCLVGAAVCLAGAIGALKLPGRHAASARPVPVATVTAPVPE